MSITTSLFFILDFSIMKTFRFQTRSQKILADVITPVSAYLRIRDQFPNSILLESSDYHANDNGYSYLCFNPVASITVENETIKTVFPDGTTATTPVTPQTDVQAAVSTFGAAFSSDAAPGKFIHHGLFGYISYDAVRYFEKTGIRKDPDAPQIPDLHYAVYQNVIAISHFRNEAWIFSHTLDGSDNLEAVRQLITGRQFASFSFRKSGPKSSSMDDAAFLEKVTTAKTHCQRGDVFQMVLSRRFRQAFTGDEFNVYRALRSINPSPYLFYFDYGNFRLFGSSPEAQLVIRDRQAEIHPIAGTFGRSGDDIRDAENAARLTADKKENAEHVMLVDLARNDLSRNCTDVKVEKYREVQFFSHVIHLVSKVTGRLKPGATGMQNVAGTFPAGTLSGAPKHKAMQLIEQMEPHNRGFYGGAIGFMDFGGNFNHAIMIRTFLSKDHFLYYQAGAGVVSESVPENELQEVYHKLGALDSALEQAEQI